jgi:hypothetical protein
VQCSRRTGRELGAIFPPFEMRRIEIHSLTDDTIFGTIYSAGQVIHLTKKAKLLQKIKQYQSRAV